MNRRRNHFSAQKNNDMTAFQTSIDRWLTTEPVDDYTPFCEQIEQALPEKIYEIIESEFYAAFAAKTNAPVDEIYWKLYRKNIDPVRAAAIISRVYQHRT